MSQRAFDVGLQKATATLGKAGSSNEPLAQNPGG